MEKKLFSPVIRDYKRNVKKNWCVEWLDHNNRRQRTYGSGLNNIMDAEERMKAFKALLAAKELEFGNVKASNPINALYAWLSDNKDFWRQKTYQTYKSKIGVLVAWLEGRPITTEHIKAFLDSRRREVGPTTYKAFVMTLNTAFKAIGREDLVINAKGIRARKIPYRFFRPDDRDRILHETAKRLPELNLFIKFIYYSFIRPGELVMLKVGHVMPEKQSILVPSAISKNKKQEYARIPKRFLPEVEKLVKGRGADEFLFYHPEGPHKPMTKKYMPQLHQTLIKSMGIDAVEHKLYSWKHTGAVDYYTKNKDPKALQLLMRHSLPEMTLGYIRELGLDDIGDWDVM